MLGLLAANVARTQQAEDQAQPLTAQQIIDRVDYLNNQYADQVMQVRMVVMSRDGARKTLEFSVHQKGTDRRLIRFSGPPDMKGMAVLIESRVSAYVFLKNMNRIRRVGAHNMTQPFGGSDFTNDDMASLVYGQDYELSMEREDDKFWYIKGTPRPHLTVNYKYVVIQVRKSNGWFASLTFFDDEGPFRRLSSKLIRVLPGGGTKPEIVTMENLRTGHKSMLQILEMKVNQNLPDSMFTQRYLRWGN